MYALSDALYVSYLMYIPSVALSDALHVYYLMYIPSVHKEYVCVYLFMTCKLIILWTLNREVKVFSFNIILISSNLKNFLLLCNAN